MRSSLLAVLIGSLMLTVACAQSDTGITTSVKARLAADETVKARQINVDTRDRVVTITGQVSNAEERDRAVQIARDTNGVTNVIDQLTITTETAPTSGTLPNTPVTGDAAITAEVKAKLLADPNTSGLAVNVDTSNGVVTLTGAVASSAEKDEALRLAREVSGVTNVVDSLTVGSRQ